MMALGYIVLVLGIGVCLMGELWLLRITYRCGRRWFLGSLFLPPVALLFFVLHFYEAAKPVELQLFGLACFLLSICRLTWVTTTPLCATTRISS